MSKLERILAGTLLLFICVLITVGATTVISPLSGGTGVSNPTAHGLLVPEGASAFNVLTGTGCPSYTPGVDPSFVPCSGGGGAGSGFAWGGPGTDGSITADGSTTYACLGVPSASTYTMVRDCLATTFTVNTGITVKTIGWRIFASISVSVTGTIRNNGGTGGAGGAGAAGGAAGAQGAAAGNDQSIWSTVSTGCIWGNSGTLCNTVISNQTGSPGGAGNTGAGTAGVVGTAGISQAYNICPANGVAGVSGGAAGLGSGGAGGAAGNGAGSIACSAGTTAYSVETLPYALVLVLPETVGSLTVGYVPGPAGGGSGGGGGGDGSVHGGGGGGSGANGGLGNIIVIVSPTITVNGGGIISADGGTGGIGGAGGSPASGNAGGGGGGAGGTGGDGGWITLVYHTLVNSGAIHATHGNGASGGTGGTKTGTGVNGGNGNAGSNGQDGLVLQISQ